MGQSVAFHVPFTVLCDSGSSIDTFKDRELLTNVRQVDRSVTVLTIGGPTHYDHKGTFNGTAKVWYHPNGIAKILSLKSLTSVSDVSFTDSDSGNAFVCSFKDGHTFLQMASTVMKT